MTGVSDNKVVAAYQEYLKLELPRPHERPKRVLAAHGGEDSGTIEEMSRICATYRALFDGLRELENDLHRHIDLENNILFPRAAGVEDRRG